MPCLCHWWCRCCTNKTDDLEPFATKTSGQIEDGVHIPKIKSKSNKLSTTQKEKTPGNGALLKNLIGNRSWLCCGVETDTESDEQIDIPDEINRSVGNPAVKSGTLYNQDFKELKNSFLSNGKLFEDPKFPPNDKSLYFSKYPPYKMEWKRASEITNNPKFFEDGASRFDINQGKLGDCWLLAAISAVAMDKPLLYKVVPKEQSFATEDYAGIFHFKLWQYGEWVDIVVDDYLPTRSGNLVFMHSNSKNEFWSALLEKAYAKLYGSYEALEGGMTGEALNDLTGGCSELYDLRENCPEDLFGLMKKAFRQHSLQGCSIVPDPSIREAKMSVGLIRGHAYSITKVLEANLNTSQLSGKVHLIRIRNPWGQVEWNGAWSDKSDEWTSLSNEERLRIGLNIEEDGEFWMNIEDFREYWEFLEICNLMTDSENETTRNNRLSWNIKSVKGGWVPGESAGGCLNFIDTFDLNPQYRFTVETPDDSDTGNECTVIISLMQRDRRSLRDEGLDSLPIGFQVFSLFPDPADFPKTLKKNFFRRRMAVGGTTTYNTLREVTARCTLPPGTYCIVPSTFDPEEAAEFYLRIFTHSTVDSDF